MLIFMADGRMHHGGLTDRLCGMISAYRYSKIHGLIFKINFVNPYHLTDIFQPSHYDWRISPEELSYNSKDAKPVYLSVYSIDYKNVNNYFNSVLSKIKRRQIHLYTNARCFKKEEFPKLFFELFKPVPSLQRMIITQQKSLPLHYVSLTFRFQQLLGDFREDGFPILKTEEERTKLIERCKKSVEKLYNKTNKQILVTSDSSTFLEAVTRLDYVHIVKGTIRHMDFSKEKDVSIAVDMKSYVDFFMLANADRLYVCVIEPLYHTGFPLAASFLYNKPIVLFKDE